jgi:hypothetical protein
VRVPYLAGKAKAAQPSLGGGMTRHRPIIAVRVTGPAGSWILDGLLDSGSDDTVLPEWLAAVIGIDLNLAVSLDVHLAGRGKPLRCRYHSITFRITDGKLESYEWDAIVGFVAVPLKYPLLGHAGFLQYFDLTLQGADHVATLVPNRSFAGKVI